MGIWHWILTVTGSNNTSGVWYGFWSGFGSDLGEVTLVGVLVAQLRARNCEVHGCWRIGRHATAAGHRVCRRHHPDDRLSVADVRAAHDAAREV